MPIELYLTMIGPKEKFVIAVGSHPDTIRALRELRDGLRRLLEEFDKTYVARTDSEILLLDAQGRDVDRDGARFLMRSAEPVGFMDFSSGRARSFTEATLVRVAQRRPILVVEGQKFAVDENFLRALPGVRLEDA